MFGFLKNLLGRSGAPTPNSEHSAQTAPEAQGNGHYAPAPTPHRSGHSNGKGVEVPLKSILAMLPLELQARVIQPEVGDLVVQVPLDKILSQLSRGTVKIPFGDLRVAVPHVFSPETDRDRVLLPLPLAEILRRINPALIIRRRVQRQWEVPAEITSPFDSARRGLAAAPPTYDEPELTPEPQLEPEPEPEQVAPIAASIPTIHRSSITSAPTPPPPAAPPAPLPRLNLASRSEYIPQPVPRPIPPAPPAPPIVPALALAPTPAPAPAAAVEEGDPLIIGLSALAEAWPDAIRREIVQLHLVDAKLALAADAVERALKQGRIAFSWKTLRSWIRPAALPSVSAQDSTILELPLKVVAPLFLARRERASRLNPKVTIDENIPNLFFGFPQADPNAGTAPKPQDTNFYVWDDNSDTVRSADAPAKPVNGDKTPGTSFVTKYATPNEIVSRAAALDGVAGALIALPDGLLVASRLPRELNGDTLAAFLPHIFAKVTQCTKELRMGELNNLNFTVGNLPWKIFRVNAIFFAAFGQAGQPLPTGQLAALAQELDHKPK